MKKIIAPLFLTILFSSCFTTKIIPLKGQYASTPIQIETDKDFNTVWDKLIDLFAQKGLPIKLIDRSSGLIISEKSLLNTTVENKKGGLEDPEAWIVVSKKHDSGMNRDVAITGTESGAYSKSLIPRDVIGEWNVRIKSENGKTLINVNIVNVSYQDFTSQGYSKTIMLSDGLWKSTGNFEKFISDLIK